MKKKYRITVAGTELVISSEDGDAHVKKIVDELNQRITDIQMRSASCTKLDAVILCALESLDEKQRLEKELKKYSPFSVD